MGETVWKFLENLYYERLTMTNLQLNMKVDFNVEKQQQDTLANAKKALLELMYAIEGHAKRFAPVDTGRLRASIHTHPTSPAEVISVSDGVKYGVFQEFGTSIMRAQPFMRPAKDVALKANLPRILEKYHLK